MNIQQLHYVVTTAERGSMTAAAAELFVAQPALSRAVRLLERELGLVLFRRAGRGVALTPQGEAFVVRARRVLHSLDALRGLGEDRAAGPTVIAASPTLQAALALPVLEALHQQGVATPTRLLGCATSEEVHGLVASGGADLGLCDHPVATALRVVALGPAAVALVSPAGLDLPDPLPIGRLGGVPLVLPTAGSERRAALDRFFATCGIVPTVAVESDDRGVWLEAVRRGLASCIWHSVASLRLPGPDVTVRAFDPPLHQDLHAVHRTDDPSPVVRHLLSALGDLSHLRGSQKSRDQTLTA